MCAHYTVFSEEEIIEIRAIIKEVSRKFGGGAVGKGDIRPTDAAPILTMQGERLVPSLASFGFPKWNGTGVNINARAETVLHALDNPEVRSIWREPALTRRCVVPSTGFYEWGTSSEPQAQTSLLANEHKNSLKNKKVKLRFRRPNEPMLYMAGIICPFIDKDGRANNAFVVLTTAASPSISAFHDRMPVILAPNELEDWIISDSFMRLVLARAGAALEWKTV